MWKKLNDDVGAQPESASKHPTEVDPFEDAPMEPLTDTQLGKWNFAADLQKPAEGNHQPSSSSPYMSSPPTMASYTEALNEFARCATAFIEQLPLLTKARNAYEQAMRASTELRRVLDTGEENLQALMTQLEQAVNVHGVKPASERKRPELAKVEAIRGGDESSSGVKRMP